LSCPGAARRGASVSRSESDDAGRAFTRRSRIRGRQQFLEIYEHGQRVNGSYFVLFAVPGRTAGARLGITATRKFGGAVQRNRIKRVVREIFRSQARLRETPIDIVVNVKAAAREATFARLEADLAARMRELARRLRR